MYSDKVLGKVYLIDRYEASNFPLNVSDLAKGMYYLNIQVDEKRITKKISILK